MKVLWAYEPFHQSRTQIQGFFATLVQMAGSADGVEAGFIFTGSESALLRNAPSEESFQSRARDVVTKSLRQSAVTLPHEQIHIIDFPTLSNTEAVDQLLKLAQRQGAGLIGLFSHSRHGFRRMIMGSFAETAIHRSPISLVVANPKTKFPERVRRVLLASDFTTDSKDKLLQVLKLCRQMKARLIVFHAAQLTYDKAFEETNPLILRYRREIDKYREWVRGQCARAEVGCSIQVQSELNLVSEMILNAATKNRADLIAVIAKSGPGAALMGGSITRQVVRSSELPVLVVR